MNNFDYIDFLQPYAVGCCKHESGKYTRKYVIQTTIKDITYLVRYFSGSVKLTHRFFNNLKRQLNNAENFKFELCFKRKQDAEQTLKNIRCCCGYYAAKLNKRTDVFGNSRALY